MLRLFAQQYLRKHRAKFVAITLFAILGGIASAGQVWLVKPALDEIFVRQEMHLLIKIPLWCVLIALMKGVSEYVQNFLLKVIGQNVINDMQLDIYSAFVRAEPIRQNSSIGQTLSLLINDAQNVRTHCIGAILGVVRDGIAVIALIGVMFYNNATLSLMVLVSVPILVLPLLKIVRKMRAIGRTIQSNLAFYTSRLEEGLRHIKTIKAHGSQDQDIAEVANSLDRMNDLYAKSARAESLSSPIVEVLGAIFAAVVIFYSGHQVMVHKITAGSFVSFIVALIAAYKPLKSLSQVNASLQLGFASLERIFATIADQKSKPLTQRVVSAKSITFKNVSFGYETGTLAIKDLSLHIKANTFVAIVGSAGSGKSTTLDLLMKFVLPTKGQILVDGQDLVEADPRSLRTHISFVDQDVLLFNKTIAENIAYGSQATMTEIKQAAEWASLAQFVESLPQGYETKIESMGASLSGGQKQKIAIARSLLRACDLLLLDEATSSLDLASERAVMRSLNQLRRNRTVIMVSHRLSALRDVDCIYVLRDGALCESGSHDELMKLGGEYCRLATDQSQLDKQS